MSAVSAETADVTAEETRTYAEVAKGYTSFMSGDVLVAKITPCFENGKIAQALLSKRVGFGSTEFHVVRPRAEKLDGRYTHHFLRLGSIRLAGERRMTGSGGQRRVPENYLAKLEIPLPPLAEQRRIAEVLDRAEALRAKRRAALAQLDALTQSLFLDLFGDPATNPKGWPISRVGEVADVQGGLQVTTARKNLPNEVPYLRVANVYRGFLNLNEIKTIRATDAEIARTKLVKDDLLIVEGHGNPAEIGRGALWDGSIVGCIHQNHIIRARFASAKIVPLYACEYLNSPGGRRHLLRAGKTTTGLNTISVSEVRGTPVTLPPIPLQREFARRVTAVEKLKTAQRASLAELDALFATLQHRAFRGEL
ncbi:MAG: restriction endonuclease subunit S [Undibacterium sp.]|nr:restriction endonuclease subunit S [Opitutaceae bacterium]